MKKVPCEIYSRVCGYIRPYHLLVDGQIRTTYNPGKMEEVKERKPYDPKKNHPHDRGLWDMRILLVEEGVLHG